MSEPIEPAQEESWLSEHLAYALEALDGELNENPDMSYRAQAEFLMERPGVDLEARIRRLLQKWAEDIEGYPVLTDPRAKIAATLLELAAKEVKQVLEGAEPDERDYGTIMPPTPEQLEKLMTKGLLGSEEARREIFGEWKPLIADHEFEPGYTGRTCERMVPDDIDGSGVTCGGTPEEHGLPKIVTVGVDPASDGPVSHFAIEEDGTVRQLKPR